MSQEPTFEEALQKLEQAVEQLENGQLPLEESLKVFEQGVAQATRCREALRQVELKVEKLITDATGERTEDLPSEVEGE